jgi:hypothetical protein
MVTCVIEEKVNADQNEENVYTTKQYFSSGVKVSSNLAAGSLVIAGTGAAVASPTFLNYGEIAFQGAAAVVAGKIPVYTSGVDGTTVYVACSRMISAVDPAGSVGSIGVEGVYYSADTVANVTEANPTVIQSTSNLAAWLVAAMFTTDLIYLEGMVSDNSADDALLATINGTWHVATVTGANTFSIPIDSSGAAGNLSGGRFKSGRVNLTTTSNSDISTVFWKALNSSREV